MQDAASASMYLSEEDKQMAFLSHQNIPFHI